MTSTEPRDDVRRAAAIVWRALVIFSVIGVVVALSTGAGEMGLVIVLFAVVVGTAPVLVVGGPLSMLVEHRLTSIGLGARTAVYALLGAVIAFGAMALVIGTWSWLGLGVVASGAFSAAGACVWAEWSHRRAAARRCVHPSTLPV